LEVSGYSRTQEFVEYEPDMPFPTAYISLRSYKSAPSHCDSLNF
jgi:hypothetical protein